MKRFLVAGFVFCCSIETFGYVCTNVNCRTVRGHVDAIRSVALVPQVDGYISKVCFPEGGLVQKGDLLYQLEKERFQFQVDSCVAELTSTTFVVTHSQREFDRMAAADARGITQVEMEAAFLQYETAKANVQQARASLAMALFDLEKTQIRAPIDGRIGASAVCPGSYVSPVHAPLAQIVQLDPIRVVFPLPVSDYVRFRKSKMPIDQMFEDVGIILPDGTRYEYSGRIDFENNVVNEDDGMIYIGARFPNSEQLLLPNAVVDVVLKERPRKYQ